MHRNRNAKIVATLGPASSDRATIQQLFEAGADVFRLNFSHGSHADHKTRLDTIRAVERDSGRPIGVLLDLQGPKLRLGTFAHGSVTLTEGGTFRLDLDMTQAGDSCRAAMPHPEIFAALQTGTDLLIDDGRVRLRVESFGSDFAETRVIAGAFFMSVWSLTANRRFNTSVQPNQSGSSAQSGRSRKPAPCPFQPFPLPWLQQKAPPV